jgi:hypothetical protein
MAVLWAPDADGQWAALPLDDATSLDLSATPPRRLSRGPRAAGPAAPVVLVPASGTSWALVWGPERRIRINGIPQAAGLRVLEDRDEIRIAGVGSVFFSTESLARVEPFPGADRPVPCARSKIPIEKGTPAVKCPRCGVWYLMTDDAPAWTYDAHCAFCPQPTALSAGFQWTPEEL